jgi:hypothetical protein
MTRALLGHTAVWRVFVTRLVDICLPTYLNMPVHAVVSWDLVWLYQVAADTVLATVYHDLC